MHPPRLFPGLVALTFALLAPRPARSCTIFPNTKSTVRPAPDTLQVSTSTSLKIFGPWEATVALTEADQPVNLLPPEMFGGARRFSPTAPLKPATTYTVTVTYQTYPPQTSTFTTASEDNLEPGTPPQIESLRLWRLRYPVKDINSGNCLFSEYVSFVEVRWKEGFVPNTPPGQTLHLFSLAPREGGEEWTYGALGTGQIGAEPVGDYPHPMSEWRVDLDPTREYCVSARALGDNDLARDSGESNVVCATVEERSIAGASDAPGGNGGNGGSGGNGARGGSGGNSGTSGGPSNPEPESSGGCAVGGAPTSRAGGAGLLALLVLAGLRRRREA